MQKLKQSNQMMNDYFSPFGQYYWPECDPYKDLTDDERIGVAVWHCVGFLAMLIIGLLVCALFGSCATKKELHEHLAHTVVTDTLVQQSLADGHRQVSTQYIDSLLTAQVQQYVAQWQLSEQERETTTEHTETTQHTDGSVTTTTDRTTDRTLNREQQQRQEQLLQQMEQQWQLRYDTLDSMYRAMESRIETHWQDSQQTDKDVTQEQTPTRQPWYLRLWNGAKTLLVLLLIVGFFYVTRKVWWPILRK